MKRKLFFWLVMFARWAAWLRAIDPKDLDLWIANERKK